MRITVLPVVLAVTLLAGCANTIPVPTTVVTAGMPNPEEALRQSMQHVDAEMAQLGGLQQADFAATEGAASAPVIPEDLQRTVNFTWSGPLDKGVAKLAQSIGYTFYTTAVPNTPPLNVAVQIQSPLGLPGLQGARRSGRLASDRRGRSPSPPGSGVPPCLSSGRSCWPRR